MKEKLLIGLSVGLLASVIAGLIVWMKNSDQMNLVEYGLFGIVFLILIGSWILLKNKTKNVRKGLPIDDELAKKITWKSGYFAYLSTVWIAVGLLWYNTLFVFEFGVPELSFEHVIGVFVLLPGLIFIGLSLYFNNKGDLD